MAEAIVIQLLLDLELEPGNALGARTVRGYLIALLAELWRHEEESSGKRPFGHSSWQCDLYVPMVRAGLARGTLDEDGYLETFDAAGADRLILGAITSLGNGHG